MIQGLHFFQASLEKALYMWRGEGFVYVERRRLCICREKKALYMWRGEGFVYVEKRRLCISGEVTTTVLKTCSKQHSTCQRDISQQLYNNFPTEIALPNELLLLTWSCYIKQATKETQQNISSYFEKTIKCIKCLQITLVL